MIDNQETMVIVVVHHWDSLLAELLRAALGSVLQKGSKGLQVNLNKNHKEGMITVQWLRFSYHCVYMFSLHVFFRWMCIKA